MKRSLLAVLALFALAACNEDSAPTADADPITGLTLVDAATGEALGTPPLTDGTTLDASSLPAEMAVRAETAPSFAGSVRFTLGTLETVDGSAPYTMSWTPAPGTHTLTATPSSGGVAGETVRIDFTVAAAAEPTPTGYRRLLHVMLKTHIAVYDMDAGYKLVDKHNTPDVSRVWGVHAHAPSGMLYYSFHTRTDLGKIERGVVAYNLNTRKVVWRKLYQPFVDSLEVTPDGKTLYMATGEATKEGTFWYVLDAASGNVKDTIPVFRGAHNTIVSLDGRRVYMGSVRYPYLVVADTATNNVVREIGPFRAGVRPFTVNGAQTLAFVNVNQFVGFEIGDINTGKKLYSVAVAGFPSGPFDEELDVQSHGVALTPDEREVWVVDGKNKALHIFDVTGLPGAAPVQRESVILQSNPVWINFSRDGRFAHISTGDVVDAKTRKVVAKTAYSKIRMQIDYIGQKPVKAYSRYGLGYVTPPN